MVAAAMSAAMRATGDLNIASSSGCKFVFTRRDVPLKFASLILMTSSRARLLDAVPAVTTQKCFAAARSLIFRRSEKQRPRAQMPGPSCWCLAQARYFAQGTERVMPTEAKKVLQPTSLMALATFCAAWSVVVSAASCASFFTGDSILASATLSAAETMDEFSISASFSAVPRRAPASSRPWPRRRASKRCGWQPRRGACAADRLVGRAAIGAGITAATAAAGLVNLREACGGIDTNVEAGLGARRDGTNSEEGGGDHGEQLVHLGRLQVLALFTEAIMREAVG